MTTHTFSRMMVRIRPSVWAAAVLAMAFAMAGCNSAGSGSSPTARADRLVNQGLSASRQGNEAAALADFQQAVQISPVEEVAYYDLGVLYQQKGDAADARSNYQKALLINPKDKSSLYNLAILDTSTDPASAVSLYQQILALNPSDWNVLYKLGLLLEQHGETAQGAADIQKAIQLNPSLPAPTTAPSPTTAKPAK